MSAVVLLLMVAGAVSFIRYARTHAPDPQLVAVAPFDIFVAEPGLEPWRVRLAVVVTEDLTAGERPKAVPQALVRERWRGASRPEVAAVELARRTSAGAAVYGRIDPLAGRNDSVRAQVIVAEASNGVILFTIVQHWPKSRVDELGHMLAERIRRQFQKIP
jgi:hypothetical protein